MSKLLGLINELFHPSLAVNAPRQQLPKSLVDGNLADQGSFLPAGLIFLHEVEIVGCSGRGFSLAGHGMMLVSEVCVGLVSIL